MSKPQRLNKSLYAIYDDFVSGISTDGMIGALGWDSALSGAGAAVSYEITTINDGHPGAVKLTSGGGGTGFASIGMNSYSILKDVRRFGGVIQTSRLGATDFVEVGVANQADSKHYTVSFDGTASLTKFAANIDYTYPSLLTHPLVPNLAINTWFSVEIETDFPNDSLHFYVNGLRLYTQRGSIAWDEPVSLFTVVAGPDGVNTMKVDELGITMTDSYKENLAPIPAYVETYPTVLDTVKSGTRSTKQ